MSVGYLFGRLATILLLVCGALSAQTPAELLERLRRADAATKLTREGGDPFYLKIDVQLYDDKGKPGEKGAIEEWWASGSMEKTVFTTPSYTATQVRKGDEMFRSAGASFPPNLLTQLLDQVIHPLNFALDPTESKTTLKKIKFGSIPLECIVLERHGAPEIPPEYCFDPGKASLRLVLTNGEQLLVRNGLGKFHDEEVPMDVTVRIGGATAATGHISALMSRPVSADEVPTEGLTERLLVGPALSGKIKLIRTLEPIYPEQARQQVAGIVLVHILVGPDGHVRNAAVVSSPSPILNNAALAAVRQYLFEPVVEDGEPREFEMFIEINFRIT